MIPVQQLNVNSTPLKRVETSNNLCDRDRTRDSRLTHLGVLDNCRAGSEATNRVVWANPLTSAPESCCYSIAKIREHYWSS